MMRSPRCETLTTASRQPAAARRSRCQTMSGLPPASTSAFGTVSVSGRSRSPRPAASNMAFIRAAVPSLQRVEQPRERRELAVSADHGTGVAEEARRVGEILGLAVAVVQAREDAHHLEVTLQSHPLERAPELAEIGVDRQ